MISILSALWNLGLVAFPFSIIIFLERSFSQYSWKKLTAQKKGIFLAGFALFLLFFPNIPYLFTDSRHILDVCSGETRYKRCPEAPWAILLFFTYGTIAIPFFILSVQKCSALLGKMFTKKLTIITPFILIPLSALGLCMGLFERLNSWEIFYKPTIIITHALSYFLNLEKFLIFGIFSLCLLGIYFFFRYFMSNSKSPIK